MQQKILISSLGIPLIIKKEEEENIWINYKLFSLFLHVLFYCYLIKSLSYVNEQKQKQSKLIHVFMLREWLLCNKIKMNSSSKTK